MQTLQSEPYLNSPDPVSVCATLALMKVRGSFIKVRGASGKGYEFRWSEKQQRMIREYRSPADFTREELDMRKNVKSRFSIVTLMGSTHPVTHAKEAVEALINAGGAVQIPARAAALRELQTRISTALAVLTAPPEESAAPPLPPSDPDAPVPSPRLVLKESRWVGDDGDKVFPPAVVEPGATKPLETGGSYSQEELMRGGLHSVQMIAKGLSINSYGKSRKVLAEEILAKQAGA